MRLLWARVGVPHCPKCGRPIERQTVQQIVDATLAYPAGSRLLILAPVARAKKGEHAGILDEARRAGFVRVRIDGQVHNIDDTIAIDKTKRHDIDVVVDRLVVPEPGTDDTATSRIADSVETALKVGQGVMQVALYGSDEPESIFFGAFCLRLRRRLHRRNRAAHLQLQQPARRLPPVHRPRGRDADRPDPRDAGHVRSHR